MNLALLIIKDHKMFWDTMGRMGRWRLWILITIILGRIWSICLSRMSKFPSGRIEDCEANGIGVIIRLRTCIGSSRRHTMMRISSFDRVSYLPHQASHDLNERHDKSPSVSTYEPIPPIVERGNLLPPHNSIYHTLVPCMYRIILH
jgi:hypothetical protein